MKKLNCRFEMLLSREQNEKWEALAKVRKLTKAELIRRTMIESESTLKKQRTDNDWKIYQKLGALSEDLKQKKKECLTNPVQTINDIIRSLDQLRLEVLVKNE